MVLRRTVTSESLEAMTTHPLISTVPLACTPLATPVREKSLLPAYVGISRFLRSAWICSSGAGPEAGHRGVEELDHRVLQGYAPDGH
jgi:hypothetical protein